MDSVFRGYPPFAGDSGEGETMTPIRRMTTILFALSIILLAVALYCSRPACDCEYLGRGESAPEDCPIHGEVTE